MNCAADERAAMNCEADERAAMNREAMNAKR
jgi:hypothetical protein